MLGWCRRKRAVKPHTPPTYQVLLLGSGETGKTTISKNLCYIYGDIYETEEKKLQYINYIQENVISGMKKLVDAAEGLDSELNKHANQILAKDAYSTLTPEDADHLKKLWASKPIQEQWELHRQDLQLPDGLCHLLRRAHIICQDSFIPTHDDILHVRKRTTGIIEATINVDEMKINIIDVGGQQCERRKWLNAFENVNCILFVSALSNFCQNMWEDDSKNRLDDSLELFDKVIHQDCFQNKDIWLYLNKKDIFKEVIRRIDLHEWYENYNGEPFSFKDGCKFFTDMFLQVNKNPNRKIFVYHTEATSMENMQDAFSHIVEELKQDDKAVKL